MKKTISVIIFVVILLAWCFPFVVLMITRNVNDALSFMFIAIVATAILGSFYALFLHD